VIPLLQRLEGLTEAANITELDRLILQLLQNGSLSIEKIVGVVDAPQYEALASITKLIGKGLVKLMVSQYPWGVELSLQRAW
jgi:predicted transcriptional regulator